MDLFVNDEYRLDVSLDHLSFDQVLDHQLVVLHLGIVPQHEVFGPRYGALAAFRLRKLLLEDTLLRKLFSIRLEQDECGLLVVYIFSLLVLHGSLLFPLHPVKGFDSFDSPLYEMVHDKTANDPQLQVDPGRREFLN